MRRVVFLNRFYWPEEPATAQLLTDLAEVLAAAIAAGLCQLRTEPAQLTQLRRAAEAFGRENSGPARAVAVWEQLLAASD